MWYKHRSVKLCWHFARGRMLDISSMQGDCTIAELNYRSLKITLNSLVRRVNILRFCTKLFYEVYSYKETAIVRLNKFENEMKTWTEEMQWSWEEQTTTHEPWIVFELNFNSGVVHVSPIKICLFRWFVDCITELISQCWVAMQVCFVFSYCFVWKIMRLIIEDNWGAVSPTELCQAIKHY